MAEHKHGTMDISVKEKTFAGFVTFVAWTVVIILATLIFIAIVNG